jgi:hypothetical protein
MKARGLNYSRQQRVPTELFATLLQTLKDYLVSVAVGCFLPPHY